MSVGSVGPFGHLGSLFGLVPGATPDDSAADLAALNWRDYNKQLFQQKTGLSSSQWCEEVFEDFTRGPVAADTVVAGAGAAIIDGPFGSEISIKSPNALTVGAAEWYPGAADGSLQAPIFDAQQFRWAVFARAGIAASRVNGNAFTFGLRSSTGPHSFGVGISNFQPNNNWSFEQDDVKLNDLGVVAPIGSDGRFLMVDLFFGFFDLRSMLANFITGFPSGSDVVAGTVADMFPGAASPYIRNVNNGTGIIQQTLYVEKFQCLREM